MNAVFEWCMLVTDLPNKIDDDYDKWLHDTSIKHDNNHDNHIDEADYELYLNQLFYEYESRLH